MAKSYLDQELRRITTLLQNKSDPIAFTLSRDVNKYLLNKLLEAVVDREGAVETMMIVNRESKVIKRLDRSGTGEHPFDPEAPEFLIPLQGRNYMGAPFYHEEGGVDFYVAVPVGPLNHPIAVLIAVVDAKKLWARIHSQFSHYGVSTYLTDESGNLLAGPPGSEQIQETTMTHLGIVRAFIEHKNRNMREVYVGLGGTRVFGVATHINSLNWEMITEIPEKNITGPIIEALLVMATIVFVLITVFCWLGLWLVNRLLKPVTELTRGFELAAKGDYSQKIPSSPIKELDVLISGFSRMISEIHQREESLRKSEERLKEGERMQESLVKERTRELKAAQEELIVKERLATLGRLTATISHELRNPLGTLRTSLFSIDEMVPKKDAGIERVLKRAERNIIRCNNIIEELLDYTRTCAPDINLELTGIGDWMKKFFDEHPPPNGIAIQKKLVSGIKLGLDRERFRRAMINIVQNAYQAMENGEKNRPQQITVQTTVSEGRLEVHVTDTGPGISQEDLGKIFDPLFSTKSFGVGLGLSIVKQTMEQHRGGVKITGQQGKGTTAMLWMPVNLIEN